MNFFSCGDSPYVIQVYLGDFVVWFFLYLGNPLKSCKFCPVTSESPKRFSSGRNSNGI